MTELLDVLDENYGEEDSKNRNDRNALELVLYPPVHEDDIDSVGDSASDNDVEPSEVLSRLSRTLLNTDAELHDKAVTVVESQEEEEEEEDFFAGWTLAEVQKEYNNLGPVRRKSRQATILAGGNVDPHERHERATNSDSDSEDGQLFAKPSQSKRKKQDERKKAKPRKKSVNEAEKKHNQEPDKRKSQHITKPTMTKSTRKRKAAVEAAILAGGNVEAAILAGGNVEAAIPAGGNVEAGPSKKRDNTDEEEEEEEDRGEQVKRNKKSKEYDRIWSNDETKVGSQVGSFDPPENSYKSDEVQSCHRPYEFFRLFTNDDYLNEIVYQSRLYAHQNGKSRQAGEMNLDSLMCLQAVMLLSGYNSVPNRRMYWQDQPDTRCPIVYDNIRRDTIDHIISILHFVDNNEESNDRSVLPTF